MTSEADGQAAVAAARDAFGRIDALVNCAGVAPGEKVVGREAAFARPFRAGGVDQSGRHVQHDSAGRRRDVEAGANAEGERGVIVNTASVAAFDGQIGQAAYAASKSGVVGMTLPIARELARFGIRVVTVAPGIFATPMMAGMPQDVQDALGKSVRSRRGSAARRNLRRWCATSPRTRC